MNAEENMLDLSSEALETPSASENHVSDAAVPTPGEDLYVAQHNATIDAGAPFMDGSKMHSYNSMPDDM